MTPRTADPQPGYFLVRKVRGGPWLPAIIYLRAEVLGEPADIYSVWDYGHPITEASYRYLMDDAAWCRQYAPHEPLANPDKPVSRPMSAERFKKEVLNNV